MRIFSSLRSRLMLIGILALLPARGLVLYNGAQLREQAAANAEDDALRLAHLAASNQDALIEGARQTLIVIAQTPQVRDGNASECSRFLAELLTRYAFYTNVGVAAPNGDVLCNGLPQTQVANIADRAYFQRAVQTRDFAVGEYQIGRISGKPTISFAYPVLDEARQLKGILVAGLGLEWMNKLAAGAMLPSGSALSAIDRNGTILTRFPEPEKYVGKTFTDAPIIKTILEGKREGTTQALGLDGVDRLYAYLPLGSASEPVAYVSIGTPSAIVFAEADRLTNTLLIGVVIVTALAFTAIWIGGDIFLLRRVRALVDAAKRLGKGDLSARTGLKYDLGELGELAREFDAMAASLEQQIAERKQAEEALRRNEALLVQTGEMAKVGGWELELQTMTPRWTLETYRIHEVDPSLQPDLENAINFYAPEARPVIREAVRRAIEEGVPYDLESPFITATGRHIWVRTIGQPEFRDGKCVRLYGAFQDITERKRAEEQLQALIESMPDGVLVVNAEGKIVVANATTESLFGYPRAELLGQRIEMLLPERNRAIHPQHRAGYFAAPNTRTMGSGLELYARRKDGNEFPVDISLSALESERGQMAISVVRDITERKRAEEQLQANAARAIVLAELSQALAQVTDDYQGVLNLAARRIAELLGDACSVRLVGSDNVTLQLVADHHVDAGVQEFMHHFFSSIPQRVDEGVTAQVFRTGNAVLLPFVPPEVFRAQAKPEFLPMIERLNIHSILFAPLRVEGKNIGVIGMSRDQTPRAYTKDDETFLQDLADRAALAIANARLFAESERRLGNVQALREIDIAITSSLDLSFSLQVVLEQTMKELSVDAADVLLLDPNRHTLEYAVGRGFRGKDIAQSRLKLGQGYAGRAAFEQRMIEIPDFKNADPPPTRRELLKDEGFVAYYCAPLIAKGQVKGVLEVYRRAPAKQDAEWISFLETLAGQAAIAVDNVSLFDNLQRSNTDLILAYDATIEGWSRAMDLRDKETEGHTLRVTEMALQLARAVGMSESELIQVRRGALLHDMGKLGIPDGILLKPGKLTDEEWIVMRRHPQFAFEMLSPIAYLRPALDIPYCHHEKWDGTGYPRGLKGEQIPLAARIFAVVDVWDALTSDRPYRAAWSQEKTLEHIQSLSGTHFAPRVVEAFLQMLSQKVE